MQLDLVCEVNTRLLQLLCLILAGAAPPPILLLLEEKETHTVAQQFKDGIRLELRAVQGHLLRLEGEGTRNFSHKILSELLHELAENTILFGHDIIETSLRAPDPPWCPNISTCYPTCLHRGYRAHSVFSFERRGILMCLLMHHSCCCHYFILFNANNYYLTSSARCELHI